MNLDDHADGDSGSLPLGSRLFTASLQLGTNGARTPHRYISDLRKADNFTRGSSRGMSDHLDTAGFRASQPSRSVR